MKAENLGDNRVLLTGDTDKTVYRYLQDVNVWKAGIMQSGKRTKPLYRIDDYNSIWVVYSP